MKRTTETVSARSSGAILLLLLVAVAGCTSDSHSEPPAIEELPPRDAYVEQVSADGSGHVLHVAGVAEPMRRASPSARVMARVTAADFYEGQRVTQGQVLVELDTQDLRTLRRRASAGRTAARTALTLTRTNLERVRTLHTSGDIPRPHLEQAEAAFAQAAEAMAGAAVNEVNVNISYAQVAAPFTGVIVRRLVEIGNLVAPSQPVAVLEDDSRLRIVAPVGDGLARSVMPDDDLFVNIPDSRVSATVEGVVSSGDARAPGLRLQLLLDNPDHVCPPGTVITVEIPRDDDGNVGVTVPSSALFERGQLTGVFVVNEESEARLRWVVVREVSGEAVRILTGLREGERVAIPLDDACVSDGRRVTAVDR